jgi:beta-aspartyl-peptidase (threonine type)
VIAFAFSTLICEAFIRLKEPELANYLILPKRVEYLRRTIIVHGGAWRIPREIEESCLRGVEKAARRGFSCLLSNGSALDAVETAIRDLEDNSTFDAGIGSVLNAEGKIELDAAIMDGRFLKAGAVAAVREIRHPISFARKVMENSPHVLLVGEGANKFAKLQDFPSFHGLVVKRELDRWKRLRSKYVHTMQFSDEGADTVGAVAMDVHGNIAAGTSTGGVPFKLPGRVADSSLIGCGLYADNNLGGVSATGYGEEIMRMTLSRVVCEHLEKGLNAQESAEKSIRFLKTKINGRAGVIVLDKKGEIGVSYSTPKMARAFLTEGMNHPKSLI